MGPHERDIFIAFSSVFGFVAFIIVFFFINTYKQQRKFKALQKEKLNAEIDADNEQRGLIATELHNDIGPYLSSIKMRLQLIDSPAVDELEACKAALDKCVNQVREMARQIAPLSVFNISFQEAIAQYIDVVNIKKDLVIAYTEKEELVLTPDQNSQLYRIIQEVIQNTIKHAKATTLLIEIAKEGSSMLIRTSDDGIGYDFSTIRAQKKLGLGLLGIHSRIEYLNGSLNVSDDLSKGTKYNMRIPIITTWAPSIK